MSIRTQKFYVHKLYMVAISSRIFTVCHWSISTTKGNIRLFNRMTTDEITRAINPDFNVSISRSYIRFICLFVKIKVKSNSFLIMLLAMFLANGIFSVVSNRGSYSECNVLLLALMTQTD